MRARLDPLVATGIGLVLLTLAGLVWLGLTGESDGEASSSVVRLGGSAMLAVGFGWAAFAARPWAAVARSGALDAVGSGTLLLAYFLGQRGEEGRFTELGGAASAESESLAVLLLAVLGATAIIGLLGLVAHASATSRGPRWKVAVLQAVTVACVAGDGVFQLASGAEAASVLALVSTAWLVAALRRARRVQQARVGMRESADRVGGAVSEARGSTIGDGFVAAAWPGRVWPFRIPTPLAVCGVVLAVMALTGPLLVSGRVPVLGAAGLWAVIAVAAAMRRTPVGAIAVGGLGFLVLGRLLDGFAGAGPSVYEWDGLLAWSDAGPPPWAWWSWGGLGALTGIAGRYIVVAVSTPGRAAASVALLVPFSLEALQWIAADWTLGVIVAVAAGLWLRLTLEWVRADWIRTLVEADGADSGADAGDAGAAREATSPPE